MQMNTQSKSKSNYISRGILELHHIFLTMQGEGPFAGTPTVFVRLFGCNLQCPFCDTDYTSECHKVGPQFILDEISQMADPNTEFLVVISGGEPFRQNLTPLVNLLLENGYQVQIETNGTLFLDDLPYDKITVVCSPKTSNINKKLAKHIDALKYVVHADMIDAVDGLPAKALGHEAHPVTAKPPEDFSGTVYVQPIDVDDDFENKRHLDAAIRSCMTYGYRLCLQLHKIINME